jgi:hypothetical protein
MAEAASLPRAGPEGMPRASGAIRAFVDAVERDVHDTHSLVLLRRGAVAAGVTWTSVAPVRAGQEAAPNW